MHDVHTLCQGSCLGHDGPGRPPPRPHTHYVMEHHRCQAASERACPKTGGSLATWRRLLQQPSPVTSPFRKHSAPASNDIPCQLAHAPFERCHPPKPPLHTQVVWGDGAHAASPRAVHPATVHDARGGFTTNPAMRMLWRRITRTKWGILVHNRVTPPPEGVCSPLSKGCSQDALHGASTRRAHVRHPFCNTLISGLL